MILGGIVQVWHLMWPLSKDAFMKANICISLYLPKISFGALKDLLELDCMQCTRQYIGLLLFFHNFIF